MVVASATLALLYNFWEHGGITASALIIISWQSRKAPWRSRKRRCSRKRSTFTTSSGIVPLASVSCNPVSYETNATRAQPCFSILARRIAFSACGSWFVCEEGIFFDRTPQASIDRAGLDPSCKLTHAFRVQCQEQIAGFSGFSLEAQSVSGYYLKGALLGTYVVLLSLQLGKSERRSVAEPQNCIIQVAGKQDVFLNIVNTFNSNLNSNNYYFLFSGNVSFHFKFW